MSRKSQFVAVLALFALSTAPALAGAPAPDTRKGVEILGMVGANMCQEDGDAKCDDIGPSVAINVAPGFRFMPYAGAYLDIGYGMLSPDTDGIDSASTLWVMPTVRGMYPLASADLHLGLGVGYTNFSATGETQVPPTGASVSSSISRTNMLDAKVSIGGAFYLSEAMALGLTIDMIFMANGAGEVCIEIDGDENCDDIDSEADVSDLLQIGAFIRYRL